MAKLNAPDLRVTQLNNQTLPDEGPKAIPVLLNFDAATDTFELDLSQREQQGWISMIQSFYIDMRDAANPMTILIDGSNQKVTAKPATQGYYSGLVPNPTKLTFLALAGTGIVTVYLINVPIAGMVWPTA